MMASVNPTQLQRWTMRINADDTCRFGKIYCAPPEPDLHVPSLSYPRVLALELLPQVLGVVLGVVDPLVVGGDNPWRRL